MIFSVNSDAVFVRITIGSQVCVSIMPKFAEAEAKEAGFQFISKQEALEAIERGCTVTLTVGASRAITGMGEPGSNKVH
ncbi:hypothetical protein [Photobacterium halotolerans]|uniref:hypothetical protein n=1 Tax=Photobacterium halotolerans TaxID=265726 RepID=UPI0013735F55|nr:hypothetical protein [Photobacterium halotolerans]NAW87171.1 hypothetical protein [Photobacterium halotolerans]